jgi:hypothetical protein
VDAVDMTLRGILKGAVDSSSVFRFGGLTPSKLHLEDGWRLEFESTDDTRRYIEMSWVNE